MFVFAKICKKKDAEQDIHIRRYKSKPFANIIFKGLNEFFKSFLCNQIYKEMVKE